MVVEPDTSIMFDVHRRVGQGVFANDQFFTEDNFHERGYTILNIGSLYRNERSSTLVLFSCRDNRKRRLRVLSRRHKLLSSLASLHR